jgi:hypothetical protein
MAAFRVDRVRTDPAGSRNHEHITHLCGEMGTITKDAMIARLEAGEDTFYTAEGGVRAEIRVHNPGGGRPKWVQTDADAFSPNNLVNLPAC